MSETLKKAEGLNVLVVDDEVILCQSVDKILKRKGHKIDAVTSVADALRTLDSGKKYDLIIADLMMPQAGGLDLLSAVQTNWPDLPVLIITGFSSIASAVESTKLGAAGYLPKPFTPEELDDAVQKVFFRSPRKAEESAVTEAEDIIDVDMPFSAKEIEKATSASYVEHLTRSDMPIVAAKPLPPEDYCSLGQRSCKKFAKKGMCQQDECPIVTAENKKGRAAAATEYVFDPIDVDMPFSAAEVAALTSEAYVAALGRSDMPVVGHWGQFAPSANRVLVVDDEAVVVNSIRKILSRKGYAIEEAFTCKDALAQVFAHDYDLVLLDMKMSDGSGLDVLERIKARRPELRVVIVTGFASVDTAVEAIQKGASDYMPKPFTPEELYSVTSRVLKTAAA
ncbi:MAG TPA: response regulator [Acidobacteriota bacterium]|nr:response regulator [Acidobacteriota bacterium]